MDATTRYTPVGRCSAARRGLRPALMQPVMTQPITLGFAAAALLATVTCTPGLGACGGSGVRPKPAETPQVPEPSTAPTALHRRQAREAEKCRDVAMHPSRAPLRRLSRREYENSLRALFPGVTLPDLEIVEDERVEGFDNGADGQQPSPLAVERYAATANAVAEAAARSPKGWAPCAPSGFACVGRTLSALSERAYRRPLSREDARSLEAFLGELKGMGVKPREALSQGVSAILQAPSFLYRPEFGRGGRTLSGVRLPDGIKPLTGRELASRMSFFLWASLPDDQLLDAADAGRLDGAAGIREEAARMLRDPRARTVINDFFAQWLGIYKLDEVVLERIAFPAFDDLLRRDLHASGMAYIDHAVWELDSWTALVSGDFGFVNERLAPLFGVNAPSGDALTLVRLPAEQRRGILTQPAVLASTSHGVRHAPILRGVHVLNRIMCADLPDPPADVFNQPDLIVDESAICTTRDEVSMTHTAKPGCISCHDAIDAAGFNFEHYDGLGRYRTRENGCPVNAQGSYPGTDVTGDLSSAVALAAQLPKSRTAAACLVQHLFGFALGRAATEDERCEVLALTEPMLSGAPAAQDSLQQLVLSLVTTPSFRSRPERDVPIAQRNPGRKARRAKKLAAFLQARRKAQSTQAPPTPPASRPLHPGPRKAVRASQDAAKAVHNRPSMDP